MKILQINTVYGTGSTGKITASLYKLATENGFEALAAYGRGQAPSYHQINGFLIGNKPDFYAHVLVNFLTGQNGFASKQVTLQFLQWMEEQKPDLIHLHNLHGFYLQIELLFDYIKEHHIPVVWTLHDCWPFTGQCAHFDYAGCDKWKKGCYNCPIYRSDYPYSLFKDNSKENYLRKKNCFTGVERMTIVTPSYWLANLVRQSFLGDYPVVTVHNGINLNTFCAKDTPTDSPKILLSVANVWEKRKGLQDLLKLSEELNPATGWQIVLIGVSPKQQKLFARKYGKNILAITRTGNQEALADWYRHAYLYVNPTLQDTFPTTNLEALACGTPVITYATGGSPETIGATIDADFTLRQHNGVSQPADVAKRNIQTTPCGAVVPKGDYETLRKAIQTFEITEETTKACIQQSKQFDETTAFLGYIDLYKKLLDIDPH